MSENKPPEDPTSSGSRWEDPDVNATEVAEAAEETAVSEPVEPIAPDPYAAVVAEPNAPTRRRFSWLGTKAALIGGAVALALATGLGGFAIGHAVNDSDDGGRGHFGERGHHSDSGGDFGGERPDMRGNSDTKPDSDTESENSTQG